VRQDFYADVTVLIGLCGICGRCVQEFFDGYGEGGSVVIYPQAKIKNLKNLKKFCVKILFCKQSFSLLNIFKRKGKDPDPDQYL
jgi:hypothetical protein